MQGLLDAGAPLAPRVLFPAGMVSHAARFRALEFHREKAARLQPATRTGFAPGDPLARLDRADQIVEQLLAAARAAARNTPTAGRPHA